MANAVDLIAELVRAHHDVVNAEVEFERNYDELSSNNIRRDRADKAEKRFSAAINAVRAALTNQQGDSHA